MRLIANASVQHLLMRVAIQEKHVLLVNVNAELLQRVSVKHQGHIVTPRQTSVNVQLRYRRVRIRENHANQVRVNVEVLQVVLG